MSQINRAIEALSGLEDVSPQAKARAKRVSLDDLVVMVPEPEVMPAPVATAGRKRILSEDHKQKLLEGRRKARNKREQVREPVTPGAAAVEQWKAEGPPRLVKPEQPVRELVIEREEPEAVVS